MDKIGQYENYIYKIAQETMQEEKTAGIEAIGGMAMKALGSFAAKSTAKKALIGAGVGAAGGALTAKPSIDENGVAHSNMLKGALGGAATGALLGSSIKAKVPGFKALTGPTAPQLVDKGITSNVVPSTPLNRIQQAKESALGFGNSIKDKLKAYQQNIV